MSKVPFLALSSLQSCNPAQASCPAQRSLLTLMVVKQLWLQATGHMYDGVGLTRKERLDGSLSFFASMGFTLSGLALAWHL